MFDKSRASLVDEGLQTKKEGHKSELQEICEKINLVMVDENGDEIQNKVARKPTDLDLQQMKKKYISKESIIEILNASWKLNGATELNNLFKQKRAETIKEGNITKYEEIVRIFDQELSGTRLYDNTCMILGHFGLSYDEFHAS